MVRGSGEIEVQVTAGDEEQKKPASAPQPRTVRWVEWLASVGLVGVATAIGLVGRGLIELPDLVMLYVLAIMGVALNSGRGPSTLAAALSVASALGGYALFNRYKWRFAEHL